MWEHMHSLHSLIIWFGTDALNRPLKLALHLYSGLINSSFPAFAHLSCMFVHFRRSLSYCQWTLHEASQLVKQKHSCLLEKIILFVFFLVVLPPTGKKKKSNFFDLKSRTSCCDSFSFLIQKRLLSSFLAQLVYCENFYFFFNHTF